MLNLKSLTICNIQSHPLYSKNLSKRIDAYKHFLNDNINKNLADDEEFKVITVQGLYGYRCGIIGYLANNISYQLSKYCQPNFVQNFLNIFTPETCFIESNDFEILAYGLSLFSNSLPILNVGFWDYKSFLMDSNILAYKSQNESALSIFNLKSYFFNPFFDSGSCIYSNKKPVKEGFERWEALDRIRDFNLKFYNNGIKWACFSENKKNINILIVSLIDDCPEWVTIQQLKQIVNIFKKINNDFEENETYIIGEFKIEFQLADIVPEIKEKLNILTREGFKLFNYDNHVSSTKFVFHNNNLNINSSSFSRVENDIFSSTKFENNTYTINPMFADNNKEMLNMAIEECTVNQEINANQEINQDKLIDENYIELSKKIEDEKHITLEIPEENKSISSTDSIEKSGWFIF